LLAASVLVVVVVVANAPRVLRHAVYYTYLSYTPQYYRAVPHVGPPSFWQVAELLNSPDARKGRVVVFGRQTSLLHYLTRRVILRPLPAGPANEDALRRATELTARQKDVAFVVVDLRDEWLSSQMPVLLRHLEAIDGIRKVFQEGSFRVYRL